MPAAAVDAPAIIGAAGCAGWNGEPRRWAARAVGMRLRGDEIQAGCAWAASGCVACGGIWAIAIRDRR